MSLQQEDESRYEFQMPKFWDLTNSVPQKRPDESWFCPENVSGPSFPWLHKKKRRGLRAKHPLNKAVEAYNQHAKAPVPEKPANNVFDRLSTHSTISASKKIHPHLSVEKGRPTPKPYAPLHQRKHSSQATATAAAVEMTVTQEEEQYQLDQDTPAEPVADRIARIEKELTLNNNTLLKRSNSNQESASQPSKIQKIINAQFSSISSSLSFKQNIPRSRPATAAHTTASMKPTTGHPILAEAAATIKPAQPAPQQRPSVSNTRSLYNKLQKQKTGLQQQNENIRSYAPMPLSEMPSSSLSQPPRSSTANRRSLYHELQSQKNGSPHQKEEKPSSTPIPVTISSSQSQTPRSPSLIPQSSQIPRSQMQSRAQLPSQPQPQPQPPASQPPPPSSPELQEDIPMRQAEATQNDDDDTATSDFFEDLLKARREKANAQAPEQTSAKANESCTNFFDSLLNSSQEKYKDYRPEIPKEKGNTGESATSFFSNLLKASEKRYAIKPEQPQPEQQDGENAHISFGDDDTLLKSSQENHKQNHSLQTASQTTQGKKGEPAGASFLDKKQFQQQTNYNSASLPPRTAIATGENKENVPEPVPATPVLSRPIPLYTTSSKQKYPSQEDIYFTDERIAKARKALRESKERTRKWLEALSPNQPMKH
ncbi:hypothetical protein MBANPS3_009922 [Mucor bainieri]